MTTVNNRPSNSPMDALGNLVGSIGKEATSIVNEGSKLVTEDINSVSTAIETGGFIGGALQFFDIVSPGHAVANGFDLATGSGALDPKLKEGISAVANSAVGSPLVLKDLYDLFSAPSTPGVRPSPSQQAVPPPNVEELSGTHGAPTVPGHPERSGYAEDIALGGKTRSYEVNIVEARGSRDQLVALTGTLDQLRNNPEIARRYPEVKYALDQKDWSMAAQSTVIVMNVLRESPETVSAMREIGRQNGIETPEPTFAAAPPPPPTSPTAPTASTGAGDFSQAGNQLGDMFKGLMGMLGQGLSFLGPLLQNPTVIEFITPLITAAIGFIPGAQVLLPLVPMLPVILPMIGAGMSLAGGALSGGGGAPGGAVGGDPIAALLGAGPSAGGLGDLLGPLSGLLRGAGGAAGLPLPLSS